MQKSSILRAVRNIAKLGDTDVFPYPLENFLMFDKEEEVATLLERMFIEFDDFLQQYPPVNEAMLAPVNYFGFRWASQLDPFWNALFLSMVIELGPKIEEARLPVSDETVFSYRFNPDPASVELFHTEVGWRNFMTVSQERAKFSSHVIVCDIAEFYPRVAHHRLENALLQLGDNSDVSKKLMSFLSNFTGTRSHGIPIGGPAARLLSELTLNQVDRLLRQNNVSFCRFADDYHIFCDDLESAYAALILLSDKLFRTQALSLQKSKTRIMSSAEFMTSNPLRVIEDGESTDSDGARIKRLMRLSLRYDPYSPTAEEDYEKLKEEVEGIDIIPLLRSELSKSRIHTSLAKKLIRAISVIQADERSKAIEVLLANSELLFPVWASVLVLIEKTFPDLDEPTQRLVITSIITQISNNTHVMRLDLHIAYAVRVLAQKNVPETAEALTQLYRATSSHMIKRDIIIAMTNWKNWYWLSDIKDTFSTMPAPERRAMIVASYVLREEGKHWRTHCKSQFTPMEKLMHGWASSKFNGRDWNVPL